MGTASAQSLFDRLQTVMPPQFAKYATGDHRDRLQQQIRAEGEQAAVDAGKNREQARMAMVLGRTGILPLHQGCTFDNYKVETSGQQQACATARRFAGEFDSRLRTGGGFIFSGECGTGKNHLAAAIGNHLLRQRRRIMVITVADLMIKFRECYGDRPARTEAQLLDELTSLDLLVLDEVGIQRGTDNELILLNQIIDRRLAHLRPSGILTNLGDKELTDLLGKRVIDRMKAGGGLWVNFHWESYRGRT